ncbi:MAG: VCBS repeat-containing protein [Bacteroidetes bacterium]|nr:VCBS repeat-containing protein [Bacteroidota bacterium]
MKQLLVILFPLFAFAQGKTNFENLSAEQTGIYFNNIIEDDDSINIYNLPVFYNGAGVAIGDIDHDGLSDVFLTSNRYQSKLYKNLGNFHFRDISATAHVGNRPNFYYTGASMVDINQDGWLDIYLCKTSLLNEDFRRNELYINNRDGTFTEKAKACGLDDAGYGYQAYFSDIDLDGDIDMFLLNQPFLNRFQDQRKTNVRLNAEGNMEIVLDEPTEFETNKLYINTNGLFKDVTAEAGLKSHTFGLSAIIEDFNGDKLPDIHICNDFKDPDVLYINKGNNTFIENHAASFHHHSFSAMGSDYADFNNDGMSDLITLDMLPENIQRYKQLRNGANYDQVNFLTKYGYGTQFEKNTLQKNIGNGKYADIGFVAGIARTDWSWTPLLADFDNDGYKDLYITNGNVKDLTDEDFHNFTFDSINKLTIKLKSKTEIQNLYSSIPSLKVKNYFSRI